jgi:hypothetical protein
LWFWLRNAKTATSLLVLPSRLDDQISKELERIQEEPAIREGASGADINTTAYEDAKKT